MKELLKQFGIVTGIALTISVAFWFFRGQSGVYFIGEAIAVGGLTMAVIGLMMASGASTGDGVIETEAVIGSSQHKEDFIEADNQDALAGISTGWIILIPGAVIFAIGLAVAYFGYTEIDKQSEQVAGVNGTSHSAC